MREEARQDIEAAASIGTKYDEAAKAIWRNREILAPVLKYSLSELADQSVEDVIKLIDADSIKEDVPVSDLPAEIIDRGTVQSSLTEKPITFDFNLRVKNPVLSTKEILVMLHIDVEFQNKLRPTLKDGRSYPMTKRGIYYAARQISSQLGRITNVTNYADIEKVVSIWVINEDIPKEQQNTATRYYLKKEDFIGAVDEPKEDYDLIEVVIIRRGQDDSIEPLLDYINSVYNADLDAMDRYTPASSNPEIKKEVLEMPGMSEIIFEKGIEQGVMMLVNDGTITPEIAAAKLNKSPDEIQRLLNEYVASARNEQD